MADNYARSLTENPQILHFVTNVLEIEGHRKVKKAVENIRTSEIMTERMRESSTYNATQFRDTDYSTMEARDKLRTRILNELFTLKRLPNDDKIRLGMGGACPIDSPPEKGNKAIIIIGLPASGKSGVSEIIADHTGSYLIDSDYAKRKLPEYRSPGGASLVHEESSHITAELFAKCISEKYNVIYPKIGYEPDSILRLALELGSNGYEVSLVLVELDRQDAVKRAYSRYIQTSRYVPLSLIFDVYSNNPILTYYRLKQKHLDSFVGFLHIDNNVALEQKKIVVEGINMENIVDLFL